MPFPSMNQYTMRRIKAQLRSGELAVPGDQWPVFLYSGTYDPDEPWRGLFRGPLLVKVSPVLFCPYRSGSNPFRGFQARFYVPKLCRNGDEGYEVWQCQNSWHDLCYTLIFGIYCHPGIFLPFCSPSSTDSSQVRFALSSTAVFSRSDTITDSHRFYNSVLDLFDDVEESKEVNELMTWWNRCEHYCSYNSSNHWKETS